MEDFGLDRGRLTFPGNLKAFLVELMVEFLVESRWDDVVYEIGVGLSVWECFA